MGLNRRPVPIFSIRKDGQTQHRTVIYGEIARHYAALMKAGVIFPPIRLWWDSEYYWLSDGFHRLAAAEQIGLLEIDAEVRDGTLNDAQWDSYSANTCHGLRWTAVESNRVIQLALQHANAAHLSNVEMAKHLRVSEHTIRRWRSNLSSPHDEDKVRIVNRGNTRYSINTASIGRRHVTPHVKSRKKIADDVAFMKRIASTRAIGVITIIDNWCLGPW